MSALRRIEFLLFIACWLGFAWWNQGGGWNQNSRFAEIRAIVEEGRFPIDDFFVYRATGEGRVENMKVDHAEYVEDGKRKRLCWVDGTWTFYPVSQRPVADGVEEVAMVEVCSSGDVAYVEKTGHFHPNKPPGTSFLALPAYFLIYHIEKALGVPLDHWWTLNLNLWLTTIFSVDLLAAVGCVLFFRLVREFSGGSTSAALLATIALAFGTTFFPFATILFDHAATASLLIAAFYCICWNRCTLEKPCALNHVPEDLRHVIGGVCAGFAVVTNYVAVGAVALLGLYALLADRRPHWRRAIAFALGGIPFAVLLGWYHMVNFGSPFALANDFQNPIFKDHSGAFLGMFGMPNPYVVQLIAVSPYRGIFWLAPIMILGLAGLFVWLWKKTWVAEARLSLGIFAFFFLVNSSFNGYHGGFSAGPRYLVPGLPFLALGLAVAFVRWKKVAVVLLAISIVQQFLLTATDGQCPLAVGGHARIDDEHRKDDFFCNLVTEYAAPLFFTGQCGALLRQMADIQMEEAAARLETEQADLTPEARAKILADQRAALEAAIARGDREPFLLAAIRGPVSVNPVAAYDGLLGYGLFPLGSEPSRWSSCNAGEFIFPQSRWSVVPVLILVSLLFAGAFRIGRRVPVASQA